MGENPVADKFICNGLTGTVAVKVLTDEGADHQICTLSSLIFISPTIHRLLRFVVESLRKIKCELNTHIEMLR